MVWNSNSYRHLGSKTNEVEKTLIESLLMEIQKYSRTTADISILDELAEALELSLSGLLGVED